MKAKDSETKKQLTFPTTKRKSLFLLAGGAAVMTHEKWITPVAQSLSMPAHAQTSVMPTTLSASLDGAQEVPVVETSATGSGNVTLNTATGEATITVSTSGLSGPIAAAHIHEGAAGVNGDVIVDLGPGINATADAISITVTIPADKIQTVMDGNTYFNIHTAANPSGEIRGQISV